MELAVLFDEFSESCVSPVFTVRPGEVVVLSAYGLRERNAEIAEIGSLTPGGTVDSSRIRKVIVPPEMVVVERLRFDLSLMPSGDACCGADFVVGQLTHAACVAQCGMWLLSPSQNVGILSLPGTYRLRAVPESAVGCFYVDAMRAPAEKMTHIPDDLWFGKVTAPGATISKQFVN